jgi:hypothetical protein
MNCNHLLGFGEEIYSLYFSEKPNYNKLKFLLKKELLDLDKVPDKKYDWNQKHFKSVVGDFKSIISDESILREGDMEENTEIPFSF